jgi:hypothetical protein
LQRKKASEQQTNFTPDINPSAKSIKRSAPIDQILLQRQHEYNARKEERQKERDEMELSVLKSPRINDVSRTMIRTDQPAHERLFDLRKQSLAKREVLQNKLREDELKQVSGKPRINRQSKQMTRTLQSMMQWQRDKQEKTENTKALMMEEEMKLLQHPKINPISERLARQTRKSSKVEDHLLIMYERKKVERENRIQLEKEFQQQSAQPLISVHSAQLQRDEPVFDRLYNSSIEHENKKREVKENIEKQFKRHVDPHTGHRLYSPHINARSQQLRRHEPVQELLYKKRIEKERKMKKLMEQEEKQMHDVQKPKVSAYSQLLVDLMEKRTNTTAMERLTRHTERTHISAWPSPLEETTFTPYINPHSRALDNRLAGGSGSYSRESLLMRKGDEYKHHVQRLREQQVAEELQECTFTPRSNSGNNTVNLDFAERSMEWARRKEQKMEYIRKAAENRASEECTFHPNTGRPFSPASANTSLSMSRSSIHDESMNKQRSRLNDSVLSTGRSFTPPPRRSGGSYSDAAKMKHENIIRSMTPPPSISRKEKEPIKQKEQPVQKKQKSASPPQQIKKQDEINQSIKQKPVNSRDSSPTQRITKKPESSAQPLKGKNQRVSSPALQQPRKEERTEIHQPPKPAEKPKKQTPPRQSAKRTESVNNTKPQKKEPVENKKLEIKKQEMRNNQPSKMQKSNVVTRFVENDDSNYMDEEDGLLNQEIDLSKIQGHLQRQLQSGSFSAKNQQPTRKLQERDYNLLLSLTPQASNTFSDTSMDALLDSSGTLDQLHHYERESGEREVAERERRRQRMIHQQEKNSSPVQRFMYR